MGRTIAAEIKGEVVNIIQTAGKVHEAVFVHAVGKIKEMACLVEGDFGRSFQG